MGKAKKAVKKLINPIATPVEHMLLESYEGPKRAERMAKAQSTAAMAAAEMQASAIRQASASQANLVNQQAQGAAQAQQHGGSWWPDWMRWLRKHAGALRRAPTRQGNSRYPVMEAAPGAYVRVRVH